MLPHLSSSISSDLVVYENLTLSFVGDALVMVLVGDVMKLVIPELNSGDSNPANCDRWAVKKR